MNNIKVSVIVPVYKVEKYLMQCIDSILNQTMKEIEVILIDEGDMDECRAIIDMYESGIKKDDRIITIHEKNGGYGASVNKGIARTKGEYISIVESDDFIAPEMYETMYNCAKNLDADVVKAPYFEYFDKNEEQNEQILPCFFWELTKNIPENTLFSIEQYPILIGTHPSIWSGLYKREYLKEKNIKCIEAKGAGYVDNHFRIQTLTQTNKIVWLNKAFNYYRLTNENASTVHYNISTFIERWSDVHSFLNNIDKNIKKTILPYCLKEEYANVYMRIYKYHYSITQKDFETIKQNLSDYSFDDIEKSILDSKDKRIFKKIKKNPKKLRKFINFKKPNKSVYVFGIKLFEIKKINSRRFWLLLFGIIPIFKYKISVHETKNIYLFGIMPFIKLRY